MGEDWQNGGFGLYIHWPFCTAKCPYCDFNSHVSNHIDHAKWRQAYLSQLEYFGQRTPNRVLQTIYFGGGTPSLMDPDTVAAIIDTAQRLWPAANDQEITLEGNPGSVEADKFAAFHQAGINRVSLGVQSLNEADLRRLGRLHSVADAKRALEIAHTTFDRVTFDLIYARQDQSLSDWEAELTEALSLASDHLSLYQLTIEDGTAFGDRYKKGKLRGLPDEDLGADMYLLTQDLCEQAGLHAYEVSNHAKLGAESRHNLIYWRYGDYLGIGPGAHSRLTIDGQRHAMAAYLSPGLWLNCPHPSDTLQDKHILSPKTQAEEYVLMGLRKSQGIDINRYYKILGEPIDNDAIIRLTDHGMIQRNGTRLHTTTQGRMLLNSVISEFLG